MTSEMIHMVKFLLPAFRVAGQPGVNAHNMKYMAAHQSSDVEVIPLADVKLWLPKSRANIPITSRGSTSLTTVVVKIVELVGKET